MEHKDYVLPEVDLSHDGGDPRYLAEGGTTPVRNEAGEIYAYQWNGLPPGHYAGYWQLCVVDSWKETVEQYEAHPDDPYWCWVYVDSHPAFWKFRRPYKSDLPVNHVAYLEYEGALRRGWPEITPHRVSPETGCVEDGREKNTKTEWWYEFGNSTLLPDENGVQPNFHDYGLDGGADSYEQALVELAAKIHEYYGNDRRVVDDPEYMGAEVALTEE